MHPETSRAAAVPGRSQAGRSRQACDSSALDSSLRRAKNTFPICKDPNKRVSVCLGKGLEHGGFIPKAERQGGFLVKPVPHYEYTVPLAIQEDFQVGEGNRYIAVKEFGNHVLLSTGTHRAHVSMYRTNPEEMVLPSFAALESDAVDGFFSAGTKAPAPFKRDMVRRACPPLLADFFDPNLCMELAQRKRRMVLRVDLNTRQRFRNWEDSE
jgi:hypothetical protein